MIHSSSEINVRETEAHDFSEAWLALGLTSTLEIIHFI